MIAILIAVAYLALTPESESSKAYGAEENKQQYTCGMHPEIISDEPGYCPICEMKLTPKKGGAASSGTVTIDPVTTQNMGLKTVPVEYRTIEKSVRAFGEVNFRQPNVHAVTVKFAGWVERLLVDYEGARVDRGQPLLEIYSPELVAAQKEILIAHKSARQVSPGNDPNGMTKLLNAARKRLHNWDISDDQIDNLLTGGEVTRTMIIRAPADGVVVRKNVVEGEQVKPGGQLYEIADISAVWVTAMLYEQDLPWVITGQRATVVVPNLPGKEFTASVSYVSPYLDERRQVEIRLEMDNSDYVLAPKMYAEVTLHSQLQDEKPAIPRSAIINSGVRQTVFVSKDGGAYEPRIVTTGVTGDDDFIQVLSGLEIGEKVVVSGQFLLDSESRLSEAIAGMPHQHGNAAVKETVNNEMHDHSADMSVHVQSHTPENEETQASGIYTCPMPVHFHVLQYGEGNCPDCGMHLVPVEETENKGFYHCPMSQCQVVQTESGRCSVCGMKLVKYEGAADYDK